MTIFACPICHRNLQVKDDLAGKRVRCPLCQQIVLVPATAILAGAPAAAMAAGPRAGVLPSVRPAAEVAGADAGAITPPPAGSLEMLATRLSAPQPKVSEETHYLPELPGATAPTREVSKHDTQEEYRFLDPPQRPEELGRLGPYRILKVLGTGGMGVVFLAEDPLLKRTVAVKAMLPGLADKALNRERFLREAQATAAIEHDHIITIFQVGEQRNVPYLVMQFLQGEPLDARMRREGRLPVGEIVRIGREIAEGLAAAHERGLIHRDIKPANIWLDSKSRRARLERNANPSSPSAGFRVKILDFGLARAVSEDLRITQSGMILGTPAYMAPEQARGQAIDHRSDLFSLGCVLYQLCTGELPFKGSDTLGVLVALVSEDPRPIHEIDAALLPALADLVMKLLAKVPNERPASATAVVEAFLAIESGLAEQPRHTIPEPLVAEEARLDFDDTGFLEEDGLTEPVEPSLAPEPTDDEQEPACDVVVDPLGDLIGQTIGPYEIAALLARGSHGAVFLARDGKKDRDVALKVLLPSPAFDEAEADRFVNALKTMLPVRHPNIVTIYGVGKTGSFFWLAEELVEGDNLEEVIEQVGASPRKSDWRRAFRVTVHVARALEFASQHHLTHGNITGTNILLQSNDKMARLGDLMLMQGLAGSRLCQGVEEEKRAAELAYLAPEQLDDQSQADAVSDLYSLGVAIYALLMGRPPFQADSPQKMLQQISAGLPVKPRDVHRAIPTHFEWVVLTMLARQREYRFQTPTELLTYLERIAAEHDIHC